MNRSKLIQLGLVAAVTVGLIAGGLVWWRHKQTYATTDNAYVQADTATVSAQIEGDVVEVLVDDNERVEPGQVLVRLDPAPAQARLDEALANLQSLRATVRAVDDKAQLERAMIAERAAGVTSAEAAAERARLDFERNGQLAKRGFATDQRLQETKAAAQQGAAAVAQAKAALEAERQTASSLGSARAEALAKVAAAEAALARARIDLERTVIRAPVGGIVGARSVRPGQHVRAGGALMAVVPIGQTFVVANFKETQLSKLRIGQPVEIRADAFGGEVIRGKVQSFAPATGAEFALIPVENAVGNFTKITQRLPVKIVVDTDQPLAGALRPGLSVKVAVDIRGNTGPNFAESAAAERKLAGAK